VTKPKQLAPGTRTVFTFTYLQHAAQRLARTAHEQDSALDAMMSCVASAFFLEAALNHIGDELFEIWASLERKLDPESKLLLIASKLELPLDFSTRPHQTVREAIRLRNTLAHGKTTSVDVVFTKTGPMSLNVRDKRPHWDQRLSGRLATRFVGDITVVVEALYSKAGVRYPEGELMDLDIAAAIPLLRDQDDDGTA
jgi:hypothetical protein